MLLKMPEARCRSSSPVESGWCRRRGGKKGSRTVTHLPQPVADPGFAGSRRGRAGSRTQLGDGPEQGRPKATGIAQHRTDIDTRLDWPISSAGGTASRRSSLPNGGAGPKRPKYRADGRDRGTVERPAGSAQAKGRSRTGTNVVIDGLKSAPSSCGNLFLILSGRIENTEDLKSGK